MPQPEIFAEGIQRWMVDDDPYIDDVIEFVMFNMYLLGGWMKATAGEFEEQEEVMKALVKDSIECFYQGAENYSKHCDNLDETPLSSLSKLVNNRIPKEKKP